MTRKLFAIIVLCLILLATLLACGYFGAKTIRRTHLRREALAAYERKDYRMAEILLRQYIQKDENSEPEMVALANIYHEFGNIGMEAQMWQRAYSLNPLNAEYRDHMLKAAVRSASYNLLFTMLGHDFKSGLKLPDEELYLYVIAACRSNNSKDGDAIYKKTVKDDPEAFHRSELGRMAELFARFSEMPEGERDDYLNEAMGSEDPVIRFEAIYTKLVLASRNQDEGDHTAEVEDFLKALVETNDYAGTPLLADFLFAQNRFDEVISVAEPYLTKIDNADLALLYAESCTFTGELDKLEALEKKLRRKSGVLPLLADYCRILIEYMKNDEEQLVANYLKSGKLVSSPLSKFIHLRVALSQDSYEGILSATRQIFSEESFHDLHSRAMILCMEYLIEQMKKAENRDNPSRMAELAKVLTVHFPDSWLFTEIILFDQFKKGLVKEAELLDALEKFPDDRLFLQITTEFLIYNGKAEQALALINRIPPDDDIDDLKLDFLHMLALDQTGRHDEAAVFFHSLIERSGFDLDYLADYLNYCWKHERSDDLSAMADRLESAEDAKLRPYSDFFRAAVLLLNDESEEAKAKEALDLLAATPTDNPEFAFFAANRLFEEDMLDEAEAKYREILNTFSIPSLIYVNLSELYDSKDEPQKALAAAKEAYAIEKKSILPAFIYAQRLSEAGKYEEAVAVLNFPRRAVNYREDVVELWTECMKKTIEKNIADRKYTQAEENCKHLLIIVPEDQFGQAKLEEVRKLMRPKTGQKKNEDEAEPAVS